MYIKIYETEESVLVAVCDRELVGQTVRGSGLKLDISAYFYKGELSNESQVQRAISTATTANIVGERSIGIAISCGAIKPENVIIIGGIPHAQMFLV